MKNCQYNKSSGWKLLRGVVNVSICLHSTCVRVCVTRFQTRPSHVVNNFLSSNRQTDSSVREVPSACTCVASFWRGCGYTLRASTLPVACVRWRTATLRTGATCRSSVTAGLLSPLAESSAVWDAWQWCWGLSDGICGDLMRAKYGPIMLINWDYS